MIIFLIIQEQLNQSATSGVIVPITNGKKFKQKYISENHKRSILGFKFYIMYIVHTTDIDFIRNII